MSSLSVQRSKMESAEHAASSTAIPRTSTSASAAAGMSPTARFLQAVPRSSVTKVCRKDALTPTKWLWSVYAALVFFVCFSHPAGRIFGQIKYPFALRHRFWLLSCWPLCQSILLFGEVRNYGLGWCRKGNLGKWWKHTNLALTLRRHCLLLEEWQHVSWTPDLLMRRSKLCKTDHLEEFYGIGCRKKAERKRQLTSFEVQGFRRSITPINYPPIIISCNTKLVRVTNSQLCSSFLVLLGGRRLVRSRGIVLYRVVPLYLVDSCSVWKWVREAEAKKIQRVEDLLYSVG